MTGLAKLDMIDARSLQLDMQPTHIKTVDVKKQGPTCPSLDTSTWIFVAQAHNAGPKRITQIDRTTSDEALSNPTCLVHSSLPDTKVLTRMNKTVVVKTKEKQGQICPSLDSTKCATATPPASCIAEVQGMKAIFSIVGVVGIFVTFGMLIFTSDELNDNSNNLPGNEMMGPAQAHKHFPAIAVGSNSKTVGTCAWKMGLHVPSIIDSPRQSFPHNMAVSYLVVGMTFVQCRTIPMASSLAARQNLVYSLMLLESICAMPLAEAADNQHRLGQTMEVTRRLQANEISCQTPGYYGRGIRSFVASLGAKNGLAAQTYEFQIAKLLANSGKYTDRMIEACARISMKPVCDHRSYCENDKNAIWIGQTGHIAYPPHRQNNDYMPAGFAAIANKWDGLCSYVANANGNNALCNIPINTHAWRNPGQANPGFMCGRTTYNISAANCTACSAGSYDHDNDTATSCLDCPVGRFSGITGATTCIGECPAARQYAPLGSTSSAQCRNCTQNCSIAGTEDADCDRATQCTECEPGFYDPVEGGSLCLQCPAGTSTEEQKGQTRCDDCETGQYQGQPGMASCINCASGRYNPQKKADSADMCQECGEGRYSAESATECTQCHPGTADTDRDPSTECNTCSVGTYTACGASNCERCTLGRTDADTDAASPCSVCNAGKVGVSAPLQQAACTACPAGRASMWYVSSESTERYRVVHADLGADKLHENFETTGQRGVNMLIPYTFAARKLANDSLSGSYSDRMIEACAEIDMKPVCERRSYCKNDKKTLYIGQDLHIAYKPTRSPNYTPRNFYTVKDLFDGLCLYTANANGNYALCNLPTNSHAWRHPGQVNPGFMCGRRNSFGYDQSHGAPVQTITSASQNESTNVTTLNVTIPVGFDFRVVDMDGPPSGPVGAWMVAACAQFGMKPVCNDPKECGTDPNATDISLGLGNTPLLVSTDFSATLGSKNRATGGTYEFKPVKLTNFTGRYSDRMVQRCGEYGMKPVCDHPAYCKNDTKALYIGQSHHIAYPSHRRNNTYMPGGFAAIRDHWNGLCSYTGNANGSYALCNLPSNTHAWRHPSQADGNPGFICGRPGSTATWNS
eukprot:COSAG05_NODE_1954_length_3791_cov_5.358884_1_plen_1088_part_00